jgi:hypothetical protein
MNRRYIIIGFAAVAVVFVGAGFVISRMGASGDALEAVLGGGGEDIDEHAVAPKTAIGAPEGETFAIPTPGVAVRVKNFYRSAVRVVEDSEVVLEEAKDYRISYIRPYTLFILSVWGGEPSRTRLDAERALLRALAVSEENACRLAVEVWLSGTESSEAQGPLPLSFCDK